VFGTEKKKEYGIINRICSSIRKGPLSLEKKRKKLLPSYPLKKKKEF